MSRIKRPADPGGPIQTVGLRLRWLRERSTLVGGEVPMDSQGHPAKVSRETMAAAMALRGAPGASRDALYRIEERWTLRGVTLSEEETHMSPEHLLCALRLLGEHGSSQLRAVWAALQLLDATAEEIHWVLVAPEAGGSHA